MALGVSKVWGSAGMGAWRVWGSGGLAERTCEGKGKTQRAKLMKKITKREQKNGNREQRPQKSVQEIL